MATAVQGRDGARQEEAVRSIRAAAAGKAR